MKRFFTIIVVLAGLLGAALPALAQSNPLVCDDFVNSPDNIRVSYYMGEGAAFFDAGRYLNAVDSFSCIIQQIDASYVNAYSGRATVFAAQNELVRAIEDYTRAVELDRNFASAYNNRGILYTARREFDLALADFNRALDIDSGYAPALSNRGVLAALRGDYEAAIADLEQAIQLSGLERVVTELRDPDRPNNAPRPQFDALAARAYALLGIVRSAQALDNYDKYILLLGSRGDQRVQSAAGSLQSRFNFDLRLDDGTWLLAADLVPGE